MFDNSLKIVSKALDASSLKQIVTSQNVANMNTPGYKRKSVSFKDELNQALGNTDNLELTTKNDKHLGARPTIDSVKPEIQTQSDTSYRTDGNNVDPDLQFLTNSLDYQALTRITTNILARYRTVIK